MIMGSSMLGEFFWWFILGMTIISFGVGIFLGKLVSKLDHEAIERRLRKE